MVSTAYSYHNSTVYDEGTYVGSILTYTTEMPRISYEYFFNGKGYSNFKEYKNAVNDSYSKESILYLSRHYRKKPKNILYYKSIYYRPRKQFKFSYKQKRKIYNQKFL